MNCFLLFAVLTWIPRIAFAQTGEDSDTARQIQIQKEQQEREKSQKALRDFLNQQSASSRSVRPSAATELQVRFFEFQMAIPKFRAATDDYRWTLSLSEKLDKPRKKIKTETDVMLSYLSAAKLKPKRPDPQEFKDYSQTELAWETLNSAERIGTFLDVAVAVERQDVVAPLMLEFMYRLNGELLRLKWLTSHTK